MSNTKRPSAARRHTRTTEENRDAELDRGYRLTIDGEVYEARVGDVTPQIARELRANTNMGFMRLLAALSIDPDVDLLSAAVWVARRVRGEFVDFDDVEVSYRQILADGFDIEEPGAEDTEDAEVPEG